MTFHPRADGITTTSNGSVLRIRVVDGRHAAGIWLSKDGVRRLLQRGVASTHQTIRVDWAEGRVSVDSVQTCVDADAFRADLEAWLQ